MDSHSPHPVRSATQVEMVRSTQSMVHILGSCWWRPGLIARELAWRWLFGIPAWILLISLGRRLMQLLLAAHCSLPDISLLDPAGTARTLRAAYAAVTPNLQDAAVWLAPLLLLGWAAAAGTGRGFVFRTLQHDVQFRPFSLMLLQLLRVIALAGSVLLWARLVHWAAVKTILNVPMGTEPNTIGFAAWLICLSLASFTLWAIWSWVLSIAGVLLVVENLSLGASLLASTRLRSLTPKLIEVNLVLGIVKLALIVLALVFSSIPLPFESVMTGTALYIWWAVVAVWYLAASDFFQVVRLAAFLELWRTARGQHRLHL